ncbi:hypothetical protein GCM10023155_14690 [Bremerella cremea]
MVIACLPRPARIGPTKGKGIVAGSYGDESRKFAHMLDVAKRELNLPANKPPIPSTCMSAPKGRRFKQPEL